MNDKNLELARGLVPKTYINIASQALNQRQSLVTSLLAQKRLPDEGWNEATIELVLHELSGMDSNNFIKNVGVGEREGRIASGIVARRHFGFSHGIGRSGEITEPQPKAAGSSLIYRLTNYMVIDAMRLAGLRVPHAIVIPMATGMSLTITLLTLKQLHDAKSSPSSSGKDNNTTNPPTNDIKTTDKSSTETKSTDTTSTETNTDNNLDKPTEYVVLWPRIDQKACLKSIQTAGFRPIPIPMRLDGDELCTDLVALEDALRTRMASNPRACVVVMTTTSCFAPRAPDRVLDVAALCAKYGAAHVINNAYGLQDSTVAANITQACSRGRVDAIIQSTDKNFMVPVGGAIIAGTNDGLINAIAKNYPGRASGSPVLDLFVTFLTLGRNGYEQLLKERKELFGLLKEKMDVLAKKYGERILHTPHNPISIGMTLQNIPDATAVGAMLFARNISGVRVISGKERKNVAGIWFDGFGSHMDNYPFSPYLTAAAAIGMTKHELDSFIVRFDKVLNRVVNKIGPEIASPPTTVA